MNPPVSDVTDLPADGGSHTGLGPDPALDDPGAALPGSARLVVVVGPSGAGKDSLLRLWRASLPAAQRPHLARRSITRPAEQGAQVHEAHEALTPEQFVAQVRADAFALRWQAHGLHYGIRHAELAPLARGQWVLLNGSRAHLPQLRLAAPRARVLLVDAPEALRAARLQARGREPAPAHAARLQRQLPVPAASGPAPDLHIVNDRSLAEAAAQLSAWWQSLHTMASAA
ncbi:phosphonate metabolism protein/1,5-bisphosphokinase (PRPP-forming) PhnN [Ideonella sp. DXS22W]|uniref:Ribose 1,5-bisphosphate phosphokinase PhnN n=1 Tax=Pseudaquabacterium inlustre TaxID=2984192 RepID=A0ABU9CDY6_9BURK